jgi:uncharacterized membrane protein
MVITNQKARALVATVAMTALVVVVTAVVQLVATYLDRETIMQGLAGIVLLVLLYTVYGLFLAKIQYDDKLRKIAEK